MQTTARLLFSTLGLAVMLLAGCASYEVLEQSGDNPPPLALNATDIVWTKRAPESVLVKQVRGFGIERPGFAETERQEARAIRQELYEELARGVVPKLKASLGPYVTRNRNLARHVLRLELNRVQVDVDGTREITFTATVSEPPFAMDYWSRKIRILAPRMSAKQAISENAVEAVVAQLRASALIK